MNKQLYILTLAAALTAACSDDAIIEPRPQQPAGETAATAYTAEPGQVLVKLQAGQTINGATVRQTLSVLGDYTAEPLFISDSRRVEQEQASGLNRWYIIHFDESMPVAQATVALSKAPGIEAVQANRRIALDRKSLGRRVTAKLPDTRAAGTLPFDDPALPYQWNYINTGDYTFNNQYAAALPGCDVGCAEAWQLCTGDPSIIVAVMDEGVMYTHSDLAANMWVNPGETLGSDTDNDSNGYKGDVYGWNCVKDSPHITWQRTGDTGHGTHVAGTIAAVNNNGIGVSGIAGGSGNNDGVKIMTLQVFDDGYTCLLTNEARGMKYAADNGAVILQCSWGYNSYLSNMILGYTPGPKDTDEWTNLYPLERDAIDYFVHYAGSPNGVIEGGLAFFASGNEYSAAPSFPAAYEECLAVSAVAPDYTPASYTDYGAKVELCAPGGDLEQFCRPGTDTEEYLGGVETKIDFNGTQQAAILSTCVVEANEGYAWYEGTSMACPNAAGVAALGLSYAKKLGRHFTAKEFRQLIIDSARDIDEYFTGEKRYYYNHTSQGATTIQMDLPSYRGRMGRLVNAAALLRAVENGGYDMLMPNVTVAPGATGVFNLNDYFPQATVFTCDVTDPSIATAAIEGSTLTVTAVQQGMTTATLKAGDRTQTFVITVKAVSQHGGWLIRPRQR